MLFDSLPYAAASLLALPQLATAATRKYDFDIGWVRANPDGAFERPVIGVNGKWPIPRIEADIGDRVIINTQNNLGNQSTSLHFHGLYMNGTTHMDGPAGVTQCPIAPGTTFTYNFTVDQPGTYWYHSHTSAQYPDGLRAPFIVHDKKFPFKDEYDEEVIFTLSDWYHDEMQTLIPTFMAKSNPSGAEPVPNNPLMNDTANFTLSVKPETTYLFRTINMGAFAGQYLWFEGHEMRIVEVDGIYTEAAEAEMIYISAAQRVSFLLTTKKDTSKNFPIVASMDTTLFDVLPPELNYNSTGWLVYDDSNDNPDAATVESLDPFDDMTLVPYDKMELLGEPDHEVILDVKMDNLRDGKNYAFFNNITYTGAKVPTLYTVLNAGEDATDASVYGTYTHSTVLKKNEIVQLVVNNLDSGRHPFHLHGHAFQSIYRSEEEAGTWEDVQVSEKDLPKTPMRRDTLVIYPNGNIVMRFKADNPGVWLFHCHIEWHVVSGLIATFVEDPLTLQKTIKIPKNHLDACAAADMPTKGNAAANTEDYLDLTGENKPSRPLPSGFTPRGIVALVFSCICGILGVAVVAWYGFSAPPDSTSAGALSSGLVDGSDSNDSHPNQKAPQGTVTSPTVAAGN
ncbi:Iron transport multicopper oxidase FET3 [Fusarium albosuccineum]|uniref:Iron transport multicopper oxidase FET3 n=1 Tax=Fusarium albosuccineum TaxID=1237068 RepID=A0A8H4PGA1_9HYPO|nr:Iron transport multicopper oxidase FET3 [Fusarium albosuccineum]